MYCCCILSQDNTVLLIPTNMYMCISVASCSREVTVERFDLFITDMEDSCIKMKAKFVDHCNKMSGRKMK